MRPGPGARHGRAPSDGSVELFLADEQSACPVDIERWSELLSGVLATEGITGAAELSVLFVDEETMSGLNGRFMGAEGPTDVLAFPLDDGLDEGGPSADELPVLLGDVVVCPAVAARNAVGHAGSYEDELALLLVHGTLHVLGMDHEKADDASAMQQRERELLRELHGPLAADPWRVSQP